LFQIYEKINVELIEKYLFYLPYALNYIILLKTIIAVIVTMPLKRFSAVWPIQWNKQAWIQCFQWFHCVWSQLKSITWYALYRAIASYSAKDLITPVLNSALLIHKQKQQVYTSA